MRRRVIAGLLILSAVAGTAVGYGALFLLFNGQLPWRFTLPWQRMESLLERQTISATSIDAVIEPRLGRIEGEATLTVARPGGDGSQVILLLNPGLAVLAITCDDVDVSWKRHSERLFVELPSGTGACTLKLSYAGTMKPMNDTLLAVSPDVFIADRLQCWYPLDLKSFGAFSVALRVPEDLEVAWSGSLIEEARNDGTRIIRWKESRPVLAVGLAAGRFETSSRVQGIVRCNIFSESGAPESAEAWLAALGDSYNYFHATLGPDGFDQLNLVVTDQVSGITRIGGPTIVCAPDALGDPETLFVALARQVAQNWWGDTVSGRWFSSRPEAGEWLVSGMSEYCAWQALRSVKGRRDYLRHMEQRYYPPGMSVPMKSFNLGHRLRGGDHFDERLLRVRGSYVAATIAEYIGQEAFDRACRNFLSVHRHTTVSHAALLHEMTLASEKPLDELIRVWFDRPGTFDYAISGVTVDSGRVHVSIENKGDIPAYVPMELGLVTADGYQVHTVKPGVHGDAVNFPVDSPIERVVLDPEFVLGDMRRANNTWPPTQWPVRLDVSRNGRIALLAQTEWGDEGDHRALVFSLVDKSPEYSLRARDGGPFAFQWDQDGQRLAVQGEPAGIWRNKKWFPLEPGAVFLDWLDGEPVYWQGGAIVLPDSPDGKSPQASLPPPTPGVGAVHPETTATAYLAEDGTLVQWDPAGGDEMPPISEKARPADDLTWRDGTADLYYFDRSGVFSSLDFRSGEIRPLLRRNYPITRSRISERGSHVAWVDPAGLLRAFTPAGGEPVYISLPGEIVDFAWEGEDALIVIVASIPRRLPMRYHADYTLWRVPASTWQGVQLPYDPVQFAETTETIENVVLDTGPYDSAAGS